MLRPWNTTVLLSIVLVLCCLVKLQRILHVLHVAKGKPGSQQGGPKIRPSQIYMLSHAAIKQMVIVAVYDSLTLQAE